MSRHSSNVPKQGSKKPMQLWNSVPALFHYRSGRHHNSHHTHPMPFTRKVTRHRLALFVLIMILLTFGGGLIGTLIDHGLILFALLLALAMCTLLLYVLGVALPGTAHPQSHEHPVEHDGKPLDAMTKHLAHGDVPHLGNDGEVYFTRESIAHKAKADRH